MVQRLTSKRCGWVGAVGALTLTGAALPVRAQPEERPTRVEDGDDRPLPGTPVTLPELLEVAEANAPALLRARAAIERGDAAIAGASKLLPYNNSFSRNTTGSGERIAAFSRPFASRLS